MMLRPTTLLVIASFGAHWALTTSPSRANPSSAASTPRSISSGSPTPPNADAAPGRSARPNGAPQGSSERPQPSPGATVGAASPQGVGTPKPASSGEAPDPVVPHGAIPSPHGAGSSQGATPALDAILALRGSPFDSEGHRMLAALVRRGHTAQPQSSVTSTPEVSPGTIAVLVQDGKRQPLGNTRVKLQGTKKDIEEGDQHFGSEITTTAQGMAAFRSQPIDTIYEYEIVVEKEGATYSSGPFVFEHGKGAIVSLFVFEASPHLNQTFVFSRALYAIEPRSDVFQVQALYRIQNASIVTWSPVDHPIRLPGGATAFQPPSVPGMELREQEGSLLLSGTFPPGQKEFSFSFQLPNERTSSARLTLPQPPHLVDAKVVLESSSSMGLSVAGFNRSEKTLSPDGQAALLADQDFLQPNGHVPSTLSLEITGIPARSSGPLFAAAIALLIIGAGVVQATSRESRKRTPHSSADRRAAQDLILDELVALERARNDGRIGPETYQRTRGLLLDSLARLEPENPGNDLKAAPSSPSSTAPRPES